MTRPTPVPVREDGIPDVLKAQPRWVCWRYEWRDGRWTKMQYQPSGEPVTLDPASWCSFVEAFAAYRAHHFDGISFVAGTLVCDEVVH